MSLPWASGASKKDADRFLYFSHLQTMTWLRNVLPVFVVHFPFGLRVHSATAKQHDFLQLCLNHSAEHPPACTFHFTGGHELELCCERPVSGVPCAVKGTQ